MPCKAPAFWWSSPGPASTLLKPAAAAYQTLGRFHRKGIEPYQPVIPVICVGNIVTGGSGKTPAVQALATLLHEENISRYPAIVLRGYGGKLHGPTSVDARAHSPRDVGDEALLHAEHAPTIIARDRAAGVKLAQFSGADFVFMDDGLQNPSVVKTISFLMIDAAQGLGNGLTLPAGPLRETLADTLAKSDAIILTGDKMPFDTDLPVFRARIEPLSQIDAQQPVIAFAGLGRPEKFRDTLMQAGAKIAGWHAFPDHHPYKDTDLMPLIAQAEETDATLMTTAKDHVRLPAAFKDKVGIFHIQMAFDQPDAVLTFIKSKLPRP